MSKLRIRLLSSIGTTTWYHDLGLSPRFQMYLAGCALSSTKAFCLQSLQQAEGGGKAPELARWTVRRKESWTERQWRYQRKPLFSLGLTKRPVPNPRLRSKRKRTRTLQNS